MKRRSASLRQSAKWCSICGLPIPFCVDPKYPLFGTVDHVVPLSLGGKNVTANRAPAHRLCNQIKAGFLVVSAGQVRWLHDQLVPLLWRQGVGIRQRERDDALRRVGRTPYTWTGSGRKQALQNWENEGGLST